MSPRHFIVIIDGPMGSGKTTTAKLLHSKLKRTALLGKDRIKFAVSDFVRDKHDNAVAAKVVLAMAREYLKDDLNLIIEQGFTEGKWILPFKKLATKNTRLLIYQFTAPKEILMARLAMRPKHPDAKKPVPTSHMITSIQNHEKNRYQKAIMIDSSHTTPEKIAKRILKDIRRAD